MVMKQVMVSELKARLSAFLAVVRGGETVLVLDRRTPVARIVPYEHDDFRVDEPSRTGLELKSIPTVRLRKSVDSLELLQQDRNQR